MKAIASWVRIFITEVGNIMPPFIMAVLLILCMAVVRGIAIEIGTLDFALSWLSACCIYWVARLWEAL